MSKTQNGNLKTKSNPHWIICIIFESGRERARQKESEVLEYSNRADEFSHVKYVSRQDFEDVMENSAGGN